MTATEANSQKPSTLREKNVAKYDPASLSQVSLKRTTYLVHEYAKVVLSAREIPKSINQDVYTEEPNIA
jgi:hypothetical protein